jgi:hypothetical protein
MQTRITTDEIQAATRQLVKSDRGRTAMERLEDLLGEDGLELDLLDQRAFLALLGGAWTGQAGSVRAAIGQSLAAHEGDNPT